MTHSLVNSLVTFLAAAETNDPERFTPKVPESDHFWVPNEASTMAGTVDSLFNYIMWVSVISVILIFAAMAYFCIKYRAKDRESNQAALSQVDHSNALEITWSVAPFFFLISIFVWGFKDFVTLYTAPKNSIEIYATGQKWKWTFKYPNGFVDSELHVPKDKNVRILIKSVDVIHSLYLPEFRAKMDAVPGRYTDLWFNATKAGVFPIYCTEYCGKQHSDMLSQVTVHEGNGYEEWLVAKEKEIELLPPAELGQRMYKQFGCAACHTLDGSKNTGPTFKGVFGRVETLSTGQQVKVDENYIRNSIMEPQKDIVQGFPPQMPSFKGQLSDKKIDGIIAFLKTVQ
ncbi:MAG TPA: cytochrome c oxidase subunit II [Polyangiaceae bacterium]|jgi:cytochrome c oxidase subunit 2|nr:cytochrome c oxidase subunit II [Polyangiaceae bacterium]